MHLSEYVDMNYWLHKGNLMISYRDSHFYSNLENLLRHTEEENDRATQEMQKWNTTKG